MIDRDDPRFAWLKERDETVAREAATGTSAIAPHVLDLVAGVQQDRMREDPVADDSFEGRERLRIHSVVTRMS